MWQFILAAAVAGSTCLVTKHFLKQTRQCSDEVQVPTTQSCVNGGPKKPMMGHRGSRYGVRIRKVELRWVAEVRSVQWSGGSRWPLCFKRRRSIKNIPGKTTFTCFKRRKTINNILGNSAFSSSKASALFDSGVRFGIMCMMAGKAEINELTKSIDKTVKIVEELKSEIILTKSPRSHLVLDYVGNNIGMGCCQISGRDDEIMLNKTKSELRDNDVKFWSLSVIDNGECESCALTEDSDPLVLAIDQLEAELEFELQKLPGHNIDASCHEEIRPNLEKVKIPKEGYDETYDLNFNSSQYHGVSPSELNQKLSRLLIEQQENQIVELESELNLAQSKLQEKEAELQALKNCVTLLTELPISTVSDHETEAHRRTNDWDHNTLDLESKQSVGDVKIPIEFDSGVYEHTKYIDKII